MTREDFLGASHSVDWSAYGDLPLDRTVMDERPQKEKSRRVRMLPLGGAASLVACDGGAAMGGGAAVMMYAVPDGNPLTYERTDSMAISMEMPGS